MFSSTPRPHFTPGKDPVPILQEAEWAPGLVWTGGKSHPHRNSIPDRLVRSQSLYRLNYPAHLVVMCFSKVSNEVLLLVIWDLNLRWAISVIKCVRMNRRLYDNTVKSTGSDALCGWIRICSETVLVSFKAVCRKCSAETVEGHDN